MEFYCSKCQIWVNSWNYDFVCSPCSKIFEDDLIHQQDMEDLEDEKYLNCKCPPC